MVCFLYILPIAPLFHVHYTAEFLDPSGTANPLKSVRNFDEDLPTSPRPAKKKIV